MTRDKEYSNHEVMSFGTVYLDIDFLAFPFLEGIFAHREVVGNHYSLEAGGSAYNFAKICSNLDLSVLFVGKIGKDPIGTLLKEISATSGITTKFIEADHKKNQTNLAVHYIRKDGTSIMTSAGSANQQLTPEDLELAMREHLPNTKYLYLGGSLKLLKLLPSYPNLISQAKKLGVKIVLDHGRVTNLVREEHKKIIHSIISDIDIYLPSKDELLDLWAFTDLKQGLKSLENKVGGVIVVKDSTNGCFSIKNGRIIHVNGPSITPINTIGAGDTFNAGFIKADVMGLEGLEEKMQFASASAGIKISTNELPTVKKVQKLIEKSYNLK